MVLATDETSDQTQRINRLLAKRSANPDMPDAVAAILNKHHAGQRLLHSCRVVVPFAPELVEHFAHERTDARRGFGHLLATIQAVTFLYQYQRVDEPADGVTILATEHDYRIARSVLDVAGERVAADNRCHILSLVRLVILENPVLVLDCRKETRKLQVDSFWVRPPISNSWVSPYGLLTKPTKGPWEASIGPGSWKSTPWRHYPARLATRRRWGRDGTNGRRRSRPALPTRRSCDMNIENRPLAEIKPYENNPRHNDAAVEAVAASIREFGFRQPTVVDENGVIVVGHTRWKAAQKLGLPKVPVHVATGLTPEQVKAFRIADNKTADLATWNLDLLAAELTDLRAMDIDLALLGFDEDELAKLLGMEVKDGPFEPDEVPESQCRRVRRRAGRRAV